MPLFWICCGVVLGVSVAPWWPDAHPPLLIALGAGAGLVAVITGNKLGDLGLSGRLTLIGAGFAVGLVLVVTMPMGPLLRGPVAMRGVVTGVSSGTSADIEISGWAGPGEDWVAASGRVRARFPERSPALGASIVLRGDARALDSPTLPGAPDPVRSASRAGIRTLLRVDHFEVLGGAVGGRHPSDVTGVLRAVAVGDRTAVDEQTWARLRRTGTAHLLAISGFHVGIIALLVGGVARVISRFVGLFRHVGLPSGWTWMAAVGAGVLYAAAAGAPVSAQRAVCCLAWVGIARTHGRSTEPLTLLGIAAVAILIVDPSAGAGASMQLSFGAVVGIARITPWILRWVPPDVAFPLRWSINGVSVTVAATLGTLPAAAWWFQDVAPLSPLANLIAMPVMAIVVIPCANLAVWGPELLAEPAAFLGTLGLQILFRLLDPLAIEPWHPAVGPAGAVLLIAPMVWPNRPRLLLPFVLCALGVREVATVDRITFLDVGQGDAALVELASGERILVDGGPPGTQVLAWLRRRGIRRLDVVAITHGDADHVGGALPVLGSLQIDSLWMGDPAGMQDAVAIAEARQIDVVAMTPPFAGGSKNDRSLMFAFAGALFTGDIGREAESELSSSLVTFPVLKVPHHGSRSSSSEALLDATQPQLAIIGVGRRNLYRHPHHTVIRRYQQQGIEVFRSDLHGTVEVSLWPEVLVVRTFRAGQGWSAAREFLRPFGPEPEHADGEDGQQDGDALGIRKRFAEDRLQEEPSG